MDNIPKILSQLKVDLVQCQQNILVPEIMLKHEDEIRAKYDEQLKSNGAFVMSTDDFEQRIQDPKFVSKLEKTVTNWIRDIRRITQLTHDPSQGSALQEINFWVSMERSLTNIEEQLKNPMFEVTTKLLQQANKIKLVFSFKLDTDLDHKLKTAKDFNRLLRDFPINSLLSATSLDQVRRAIDLIFNQFRQVRTGGDSYPNTRAILLMNAVTQDLNEQLLKILSNFQIMHLDYPEFEALKKEI